jgi:hypothetical protein
LQFWGLNSGSTPWATLPALFVMGSFRDGSQELLVRGRLQTMILLISASWVTRITGVSQWRPAYFA